MLEILAHPPVIDPAEKAFRGAFDTVTVLLVKTLGAFASVQDEVTGAGFLSAFFQRAQNHAPESATLRPRINRHEPNLRFRRAIQMKATDGQCFTVLRAHHQMNAFVLAIIAFRSLRLLPGRPQHAPAQIEIALEFRGINGRDQRRARQRIVRPLV